MEADLVLVALAGFFASMVDGALGMGFGPTSSSILLATGISPAAASTTVNLAKVATGLAAGVSHWRFGNIDRRLVLRLAGPGAVGACIGSTVLANVDGDDLRPILAVLLLAVGVRILIRFSRSLAAGGRQEEPGSEFDVAGVEVAATAGGVTNGLVGAWGPVVTPFLLHRGLSPRYAVGCANTAEIAVAVVASGTLLGSVGGGGLELGVVLAMLIGGVVASPIAAYVVRLFPARLLGLSVAGLLLLTQARELAGIAELGASRWWVYGLTVAVLVAAACRPRLGSRRDENERAAAPVAA